MDNININFVNIDKTQSIKEYVLGKIKKYEHLYIESTDIEVFLKEEVKDMFRVDINIYLPKSKIKVGVRGKNMYANIDEATDTMARRLKRYSERKKYWEGSKKWEVLEDDRYMDINEPDDYSDYIPKITERRKIEDLSPIEDAEAIEKMEMLGYNQLLFRRKENNKIAMVYKREEGGYGLAEPIDTVLD